MLLARMEKTIMVVNFDRDVLKGNMLVSKHSWLLIQKAGDFPIGGKCNDGPLGALAAAQKLARSLLSSSNARSSPS